MRNLFLLLCTALFLSAPSSSAEGVTAFCEQPSNSGGSPGALVFTGSLDAAANDITFDVSCVPAGKFGILAYTQGSNGGYPFGNGTLCLNPWSLTRVSQVFLCAGADPVHVPSAVPSGPVPGHTYNFQALYRDAGMFSLTNALRVEFAGD